MKVKKIEDKVIESVPVEKDYYNCPYCQAEKDGISKIWGLSDEGWRQIEREHKKHHTGEGKNTK